MLEQTFIQKIIEAIDTKYLAALRNPITGQITSLVPTILEFLYNNYGRITPQQLDDKKTTVKSMIYDPSQPIDIIFSAIDDLVEYARVTEAELTQSQTINLSLVILNRKRIFKGGIRACKRTNQAYKIWDNFKHDFREAHLKLRETGERIDKLGFHNTNAIVDQMMARLQIDEDERIATATQHATELASASQANASMESQMQNLLTQIQTLQLANTPNHGNNYGCGSGRGRGRGRSARRSHRCALPSAPPTPNFFWSQRNCGHGR